MQVLFLVEPIDEVAITNLQSYKDKKFVDISKEDLDLGKEFTISCKHTIVSSTNQMWYVFFSQWLPLLKSTCTLSSNKSKCLIIELFFVIVRWCRWGEGERGWKGIYSFMWLDETKPWRQGCQGPSFEANQLITLCACVWKVWLVGKYGEVCTFYQLGFCKSSQLFLWNNPQSPSV